MRHYGCLWINHSRASDQWDETIQTAHRIGNPKSR
jgi:hypothetical protein